MQVSIEQLLSGLMSKLETMEASLDDIRLKNNVLLRLIKEMSNKEITLTTIQLAVKEELKITKEAGLIEEDQDTSITEKRITDSIYKWLEGDVSDIKEQVNEYRKKLEEAQRQHSGNIDIAPPNFVDTLGNQNKKGKDGKIIL
ncbi:MAG: hypothetical protein PWQ77_733 [Kosmotogales bacterium]|nr:hypothetical protein [Kosmotogales bacterium]